MKNYYEIEGDFVRIRLDRKDGFHFWTLVDLADFDTINEGIPGKIYALYHETIYNYYAAFYRRDEDGKSRIKLLHRFLMGFPQFPYGVSHMDRQEPLDNRRQNLRILTVKQRNQSAGMRFDNKSGIRGVSWNKRTQLWWVFLTDTDGKYKSFGSFKDKEKAKEMAIKKDIEIKGELSQYYNKKEIVNV